MKMAFISDIHGNANALEAVLKDIKQIGVDEIAVLGDLCYRGPEPQRALELIQANHDHMIKGNADEWLVRGIQQGEVADQALEMMRKEREWSLTHLNDDDLTYLQELPTQLHLQLSSTIKIHAFHATPANLFDMVLPYSSNDELRTRMMLDPEATIYLYAHIHLPYVRYIDGKCIVNLGSVGLPFDGLPKAAYVLLEVEGDRYRISIERVRYDVEETITQLHQFDYPNAAGMKKVLRQATSPN